MVNCTSWWMYPWWMMAVVKGLVVKHHGTPLHDVYRHGMMYVYVTSIWCLLLWQDVCLCHHDYCNYGMMYVYVTITWCLLSWHDICLCHHDQTFVTMRWNVIYNICPVNIWSNIIRFLFWGAGLMLTLTYILFSF